MRRITARGAELALVTALALSLSGCFEWVQYGYDAGRSSYNPTEETLTADTIGQLTELWSSPLVPSPRNIVASNSRLVIATDDHIYGLDVATGDVVWDHPSFDSSPVIHDGLVYTASIAFPGHCAEAALEARDVETGARRVADDIRAWDNPATCLGPSDLTAVGRRFALLPSSGYDAQFNPIQDLFAYEWDTGATYDLGGTAVTMDESTGLYFVEGFSYVEAAPLPGSANPGWTRVIQTRLEPVTAAGRVYLVQPGGTGEADRVLALDAATGADAWSGVVDVGEGNLVKPAVREGTVFTAAVFGPRHGQLVAFANCGAPACAPAWTGAGHPVPSGGSVGGPVVAGDLVYVSVYVSDDSPDPVSQLEVYDAAGCDAATCDPLTTVTVDGYAGEVVVSNGRVFFVTSTGVHAFGLP